MIKIEICNTGVKSKDVLEVGKITAEKHDINGNNGQDYVDINLIPEDWQIEWYKNGEFALESLFLIRLSKEKARALGEFLISISK